MPSGSSNLKGQFLLVEPFAVGVVDKEVERGVGAHKDVGEADYDVAGGERRNSPRDVPSGRQQSFVDMNLLGTWLRSRKKVQGQSSMGRNL